MRRTSSIREQSVAPVGERATLRIAERTLALLAAALLVVLHFVLWQHAGALWRDEAATVGLAAMPGLSSIWSNLPYTSFSALHPLIIRVWMAPGLDSDLGLRLLGLVVGVSIVGALWWNALRLHGAPPILSMLLLGFNPAVIRWGDSLRAYGLGTLLILLLVGAVWRIVEGPTVGRTLRAAAVAVLSVQCLYQNAVLVFAICVAGMVVTGRHRLWRRTAAILGVGLSAALSLLPYLGAYTRAKAITLWVRWEAFGPRWFWERLSESLGAGGFWISWLWVGLSVLATIIGIWAQLSPASLKVTGRQRDLAMFSIAILVIGVTAYYALLKIAGLATQPWYYLALMAVVAVVLDAVLSLGASLSAARTTRLAFVLLAGALMLPTVWRQSHERASNIDLIADVVQRQAAERDLIVVTPWYLGITFDRYYHGSTSWLTVPPLAKHELYRPVLLLDYMTAQDQAAPVRPLLEKIEGTLRAGGKVWVVGPLPFVRPGERPLMLPPAPNGPLGWNGEPYEIAWAQQVSWFITQHVLEGESIASVTDQPVNKIEKVPLGFLTGWRSE